MPSAVTPSATWQLSAVTVPNDGESVNKSSLLDTFLQRCVNSIEFKAAQDRSCLVQIIPIANQDILGNPANPRFTYDTNGSTGWKQSSVSDSGILVIPVPLLNSGKLQSLTIRVKGAAIHGALPANMPSFFLNRITESTGGASSQGSAVDGSASTAAYEAAHDITFTPGSPITLTATHRFEMYFSGESGANSLAGLQLIAIRAVYTET